MSRANPPSGEAPAAPLRPDVHAEHARDALVRARDARASSQTRARLDALQDAQHHAQRSGDAALLATACWRLAKACFDADLIAASLDALDPLLTRTLERENFFSIKRELTPFSHYPPGLGALEPLSRAFTDRFGYHDPRLLTLWDAAVATLQQGSDPYLTARAVVERAWLHACTGQHAPILREHERYARMTPADFGQGPTRHPRATGRQSSLPWVNLDLARTALWCATWRQDEDAAWYAREALEDAAEEAGLARHTDIWHLDAALHAALRFGWESEPDARYLGAILGAAALPAPHALRLGALHLRLKGEDARDPAHRAADAALREHAGPEWAVQAIALDASPEATARLGELTAQYGVHYAR